MSNNYENNNEQLINEAGETVFENIYTNCQNETKDQIISKLLSKIEKQNERINNLEKENKKLKDNFTYVLKRILSNKEEFSSNNNNYNNIIRNYNTVKKKQNNSRNNVSYTINQNNSVEYFKLNYSTIESNNRSKKKFNINNSVDNLSLVNFDEEKNNNVNEAKAKKYLNDLYRNNFDNTDGIPYSNFINKNISLYEELFPSNGNKNSYIYTETGSSYESPYKRRQSSSFSKRNKSTGVRNKILIEDFDKISNEGKNKNNKKKNVRNNDNENGSMTDRKKNSSIDRKNRHNYYIRNIKRNIPNYKLKDYKKNINNNDSNKKNNTSFVKRSPYLLNKY